MGPGHDGWEGYKEVEREQLAQRATGKMTRMIGLALQDESQEELELIASDDLYLTQQGYVLLRQGKKVWHKHISELTREDAQARLEYEKTLVRWLRGRIAERKKRDRI